MTRRAFIERTLRQIYGGFWSDDSQITVNLVNFWLSDAIAIAAKANVKDNLAIDGISYVNNSFYTIFKELEIEQDEQFLWKVTLPEIPLGLGNVDGISTIQIKDNSSPQISYPVILMSENQRSFQQGMRPIPNKVLGYPQGEFIYIVSTIILSPYTAYVTMISGGDATDLDSTLNVPPDYFSTMVQYIQQQLLLERNTVVDAQNDGLDAIKTT